MDNIKIVGEMNCSQNDQLKKLTVRITYLTRRSTDRINEEENASHTSFKEKKSRKRFITIKI